MADLPTVNDVARAAGVSRQTVSNVLNSPEIVRPATRERVQAVIGRLGYRPHASARRLRTRRSATLAVRIDSTPAGVSGSVLDGFLHALTRRADRAGLRVMLYTADGPDEEVRVIRRLIAGSDVDAFVLTSTFHGDPRTAWLLEQGQPFVTFGRPWGETLDDRRHLWVDVDGRAGVRAATEHLLADGRGPIAFLGWPAGSGTGDDRRQGWHDAMAAAGWSPADLAGLSTACEDDLATGRAAASALLARRGDAGAVVAASDTLAIAALMAVAGRLPVVGFDNTPVAASLGFSSVDQRLDAVAAHVLTLVDQAQQPTPAGPAHFLVQPELIVRQRSAALDLLPGPAAAAT